jgi:hypothetical protein
LINVIFDQLLVGHFLGGMEITQGQHCVNITNNATPWTWDMERP